VPEIHIERAHDDVKFRLHGSHQISYLVVGMRENVGILIPQLLRNRCINATAALPKSGLQVLNPQWCQRYYLDRNLAQPVRFGVVFEDKFPDWSAGVFSEPALIHVIYWLSKDPAALQCLAEVRSKLVVAPIPLELKADLLKAGIDQDCIAENPDEIFARIERQVHSQLHSRSERDFEDRIAANRKIADRWREQVLPGAQRPFNPLDVNRSQLRQLLGQFNSDFWRFEKEKQLKERGAAQVATFQSVVMTLFAISKNDSETRPFRPPPAIFAFPSISPFLKQHLEDGILKVDKKLRSELKKLVSLRLEEQDSSSFEFKIGVHDEELVLGAMSVIAPEVAAYTRFFDDVGYLHASFRMSPYLRGALKGKSLAQQHSFFAPGTFPLAAKSEAILRRITTFSNTLTAALDPRMHRAISDYAGGIVGLSDLPLEWLVDRGVPICFSHDVCRIPETGATNMLSQFNRNSHFSFQIDSNILAKILVVCGAPKGDPIQQGFEAISSLWKEDTAPWKWEHCDSLAQLYAIVNDFRPQLLIFDTHGRFTDNNSGSELQIGGEFLNGPGVIEHLPQIPLVMLSTCWGAPLYGCPNTIAHAFFESGAFAVTSSMLPIDAAKGAILYSRVLGNLKYACEHPVHENWSSFMSHNVRTSYFDDLKARIMRRYPNKLVDQGTYRDRRGNWQAGSMPFRSRRKAFLEAPRVVIKCFDKSISAAACQIMTSQGYVPEFMYYSTMGRADLVEFASWNRKHHIPRDPQPTFGELRSNVADAEQSTPIECAATRSNVDPK
jgi:hypothetical protein